MSYRQIFKKCAVETENLDMIRFKSVKIQFWSETRTHFHSRYHPTCPNEKQTPKSFISCWEPTSNSEIPFLFWLIYWSCYPANFSGSSKCYFINLLALLSLQKSRDGDWLPWERPLWGGGCKWVELRGSEIRTGPWSPLTALGARWWWWTCTTG